MLPKKKEHPKEKAKLHPRNKHRERYDFEQLIACCPELAKFVKLNIYNDNSIDFFDPEAVRMLNKALLKAHYGIDNWEIPVGYLCPPIPGRADYIHHIADLLCGKNYGKVPSGNKITCLDIGVGANCVYPIIGVNEYGWSFVGSEIDTIAIESAKAIVASNPSLTTNVEIRLQANPKDILYGILRKDEFVDLVVCNPPFHGSLAEVEEASMRKLSSLKGEKVTKATLNFGGQNTELWCNGGEERFIRDLVRESKKFADSCFWFSTLVSKQTTLKNTYEALRKVDAIEVKTIPMGQGTKSSRIVAWTFLSPIQQKQWANSRWNSKI